MVCRWYLKTLSLLVYSTIPGQAPKRDPDQIAAIEKRRKLTLKPKPVKTEVCLCGIWSMCFRHFKLSFRLCFVILSCHFDHDLLMYFLFLPRFTILSCQ